MGQGLGGRTAARDAVTPLAPRLWGWQHPGAAPWTPPRPLGTRPGWGRNAPRRVRGGAGTPPSRGHGKERGQRWNPPPELSPSGRWGPLASPRARGGPVSEGTGAEELEELREWGSG